MLDKKISFIGAGKIAEILIGNMTARGVVSPERIMIGDQSARRLEEMTERFGVNAASSNREAVEHGDVVFVCVRSENVAGVVEEIRGFDFSGKTLVSISSGVPMSLYREAIPGALIVRALPNPPSKIGHGVIALAFDGRFGETAREEVMEIFSSMGKCFILPEEKINVITSVTGPAPVFAFCEAAIQACVLLGIDHKTSESLVFHTISGCLKEWEENLGQMGKLLTETSTPGGISVQQLFSLDKGAFNATVKGCYVKGWEKTSEVGERIARALEKAR